MGKNKHRQNNIVKDTNMDEKINITDNLEENFDNIEPEFEDTRVDLVETITNDVELKKEKVIEKITSNEEIEIKHEIMKHCKLSMIYGSCQSFEFVGSSQNLGPIKIYTINYNGNELKIKAIKNGDKTVYGIA